MLLGQMRTDNPSVLRSAHLFAKETAVSKQMQSAIAIAGNLSRQAFTEIADLARFPGELTTLAEQARLSAFLAAGG